MGKYCFWEHRHPDRTKTSMHTLPTSEYVYRSSESFYIQESLFSFRRRFYDTLSMQCEECTTAFESSFVDHSCNCQYGPETPPIWPVVPLCRGLDVWSMGDWKYSLRSRCATAVISLCMFRSGNHHACAPAVIWPTFICPNLWSITSSTSCQPGGNAISLNGSQN